MGARGIFIAGYEGGAMRNGRLNGAPAGAAPEGKAADGEEKENTPPQDRLLSLGANFQKSKLHSGFIVYIYTRALTFENFCTSDKARARRLGERGCCGCCCGWLRGAGGG